MNLENILMAAGAFGSVCGVFYMCFRSMKADFSEKFNYLRVDMQTMEKRVEARMDSFERRAESHERRMETMEQRIDRAYEIMMEMLKQQQGRE